MARLSGPQRLADTGVRLLYTVAAIALLWVAQERAIELREGLQVDFEFSELRWVQYVAAAVLAGIMAGLAIRSTGLRARGYRWEVALLLALPPGLLLLTVVMLFNGILVPPSWTFQFVLDNQTPAGLLVGLAIMAGFIARDPVEPD